jgi:hypothetical protein
MISLTHRINVLVDSASLALTMIIPTHEMIYLARKTVIPIPKMISLTLRIIILAHDHFFGLLDDYSNSQDVFFSSQNDCFDS